MKLFKRDFTLIELLVVVGIIAVIAGFVLAGLRGSMESARRAARMRDEAASNRLLVCGQGQIMDVDRNLYDTVEIGGICWMTSNLRYLPSVSPSAVGSETEPRFYVYDYQGTDVDAARAHSNFTAFGVLYNWQAAMDACPPGTRLPTDEELHILERTFAIGTCDPARSGWDCSPAGNRLRHSTFGAGTNESGFSALGAGYRNAGGNFWGLGSNTLFWSSNGSGVAAWYRYLAAGQAGVNRWLYSKAGGFSVRCVR